VASPFEVDGVRYHTAEHYMMWQKAMLFGDQATAGRVLDAGHPQRAKALGRGGPRLRRVGVGTRRFGIVVAGSMAKFGAHDDLRAYLVGTGDRVLWRPARGTRCGASDCGGRCTGRRSRAVARSEPVGVRVDGGTGHAQVGVIVGRDP